MNSSGNLLHYVEGVCRRSRCACPRAVRGALLYQIVSLSALRVLAVDGYSLTSSQQKKKPWLPSMPLRGWGGVVGWWCVEEGERRGERRERGGGDQPDFCGKGRRRGLPSLRRHSVPRTEGGPRRKGPRTVGSRQGPRTQAEADVTLFR